MHLSVMSGMSDGMITTFQPPSPNAKIPPGYLEQEELNTKKPLTVSPMCIKRLFHNLDADRDERIDAEDIIQYAMRKKLELDGHTAHAMFREAKEARIMHGRDNKLSMKDLSMAMGFRKVVNQGQQDWLCRPYRNEWIFLAEHCCQDLPGLFYHRLRPIPIEPAMCTLEQEQVTQMASPMSGNLSPGSFSRTYFSPTHSSKSSLSDALAGTASRRLLTTRPRPGFAGLSITPHSAPGSPLNRNSQKCFDTGGKTFRSRADGTVELNLQPQTIQPQMTPQLHGGVSFFAPNATDERKAKNDMLQFAESLQASHVFEASGIEDNQNDNRPTTAVSFQASTQFREYEQALQLNSEMEARKLSARQIGHDHLSMSLPNKSSIRPSTSWSGGSKSSTMHSSTFFKGSMSPDNLREQQWRSHFDKSTQNQFSKGDRKWLTSQMNQKPGDSCTDSSSYIRAIEREEKQNKKMLAQRGKAVFDVPQRSKLPDRQGDHLKAVSRMKGFKEDSVYKTQLACKKPVFREDGSEKIAQLHGAKDFTAYFGKAWSCTDRTLLLTKGKVSGV